MQIRGLHTYAKGSRKSCVAAASANVTAASAAAIVVLPGRKGERQRVRGGDRETVPGE